MKKQLETVHLYQEIFVVSLGQISKPLKSALQLEFETVLPRCDKFCGICQRQSCVFIQAQTDKAQAEYRLLFQKVLVDYAVGTLKPEDFQLAPILKIFYLHLQPC